VDTECPWNPSEKPIQPFFNLYEYLTKMPEPTNPTNSTLEDDLLEMRRLLINAITDGLKAPNPKASFLAISERVLSTAGLLGKLPPHAPPADHGPLPYETSQPATSNPTPVVPDVGYLPYPTGELDGDTRDDWKPLERPFVVD
jgi:hypothetical protein